MLEDHCLTSAANFEGALILAMNNFIALVLPMLEDHCWTSAAISEGALILAMNSLGAANAGRPLLD